MPAGNIRVDEVNIDVSIAGRLVAAVNDTSPAGARMVSARIGEPHLADRRGGRRSLASVWPGAPKRPGRVPPLTMKGMDTAHSDRSG